MFEWIKKAIYPVVNQGTLDILIETWGNVTETVQIFGLTETGRINALHVHTPFFGIQTSIIRITDIPSFLTARATSLNIARGEIYMKASLRVEGVVVALLMAGYITENECPSWPNGKIESSTEGEGRKRVIAGNVNGAGEEISFDFDQNTLIRINYVEFVFATDATVANRFVQLRFADGANVTMFSTQPQAVQAASRTVKYVYFDGQLAGSAVIGTMQMTLPSYIKIPSDANVQTSTSLLQAGDLFSAPIIYVEEWLQVN